MPGKIRGVCSQEMLVGKTWAGGETGIRFEHLVSGVRFETQQGRKTWRRSLWYLKYLVREDLVELQRTYQVVKTDGRLYWVKVQWELAKSRVPM
jgi:hypothetical protein